MEGTRYHTHEEVLPTTPQEVFALLHTPSAIRQWWAAARAVVLPEVGGAWAAAWGDDEDAPEYVVTASIREFEPPRAMVLENYRYRAKAEALPFQAEFVIKFLVSPDEEGARLRITQEGFPAGRIADDFYTGCQEGWKKTFAGIRRYLDGERRHSQ